jgi:hypothetical protein
VTHCKSIHLKESFSKIIEKKLVQNIFWLSHKFCQNYRSFLAFPSFQFFSNFASLTLKFHNFFTLQNFQLFFWNSRSLGFCLSNCIFRIFFLVPIFFNNYFCKKYKYMAPCLNRNTFVISLLQKSTSIKKFLSILENLYRVFYSFSRTF